MTEFNFATMETENLDYRTMTKKDADDIKKNEEILSERTTKSGLRIVSDTYAVRTGITFPKKPIINSIVKPQIKVSIVWEGSQKEDVIFFDYHIGLKSINEVFQGYMNDAPGYGAIIEHMEIIK